MKYFFLMLMLVMQSSFASTNVESSLFEDLKQMDALLFERVFNQCELDLLPRIIDEDFEFYHDESGVQERAAFLQSLQDNICSSASHKPLRKLVPGSMTVYEMQQDGIGYGAVQTGEHDFFIQEQGKALYKTSTAKFTHLWAKVGQEWKLKRVISFDHRPPKQIYPDWKTEQKFRLTANQPLFNQDSKIESLLADNNIPSVAIGFIENGNLQQVRVFGDRKNIHQPSLDSLYNVASLTKPIVALVVLKLVDSERWQLDGPLAEFFVDQDLKGDPLLNSLTTRHVLSHQSGFANWRHLSADNKLAFQFPPGSKYQYSGEGFEYLRKAVEAKFNRPFTEIASEVLFQPIGMHDTHFTWTDALDEQRYQREHNESGQAIPLDKHRNANAADNLITTAQDYAKFMVHIMQGAGLSPTLYNEMLTQQAAIKPGVAANLGWERFSDLQSTHSDSTEFALQHTGADSGTRAIAVMLPNSKRGVVVLSNSENAGILWPKILMEYFGEVGENLITANLR